MSFLVPIRPAAALRQRQPRVSAVVGSTRKCHGFSLLELGIVAVVLSLIALVFANRLLYYQEMAEKADVEYTVRALKSVLRMKMASMMFDGRAHEFGTLAYANPMDWLDRKPANYAGRFDTLGATSVPPGSWYFNTDQHVLAYRIRRGAHFSGADPEKKEIGIRVEPIKGTLDKDSLITNADSVTIRYVASYKWL